MKGKIELTVVQNFSSNEIAKMVSIEVKKEIKNYLEKFNENQTQNDKRLSRKETADYFNISVSSVDLWARNGILKRHKVSNRTYFLLSELESVLKNSNI